jgi:hypothetical protein
MFSAHFQDRLSLIEQQTAWACLLGESLALVFNSSLSASCSRDWLKGPSYFCRIQPISKEYPAGHLASESTFHVYMIFELNSEDIAYRLIPARRAT